MIIKNSILGVFAMALLLGFNTVSAADCKFAVQETDPQTGKPKLATKIVTVSTAMATNSGAVQFVSMNDEKFVAVRLRAINHYPIPPEYKINLNDSNQYERTGKYDPRLNAMLKQLERDAQFVPAGSTLRITLEDRSVIVLEADGDSESRNSGQSPLRNGNETRNFVIMSQVSAMYPLDADTINALTSRLPISMRMETAERYYEFASRMNIHYPLTVGKKNGQQFQEGLNCVL